MKLIFNLKNELKIEQKILLCAFFVDWLVMFCLPQDFYHTAGLTIKNSEEG